MKYIQASYTYTSHADGKTRKEDATILGVPDDHPTHKAVEKWQAATRRNHGDPRGESIAYRTLDARTMIDALIYVARNPLHRQEATR